MTTRTSASGPRETLAQRVRDVLASHHNVRERRMFGGVSFMVDERMAVAAGRDGDLLVRTDPELYDEMLRRGAEPARMGKDRQMGRGWLAVPHRHVQGDEDLAYWVKVGVDSRPAKD